MRSKIFLGGVSWLLVTTVVTLGSLFAVSQLARGILEQPTKQLSVAAVNADLAVENSERGMQARPSHSAAASPTPSPDASPSRSSSGARGRRGPDPDPASPSPGANERVFTTTGGTVAAECGRSGAYLEYWSPQQGYAAGRVVRGPARVASVTFYGLSGDSGDDGGGIQLDVFCRGLLPVAHQSHAQSEHWWGDSGH